MENTIEVNGITYKQIQRERVKTSKSMNRLLLLGGIMGGLGSMPNLGMEQEFPAPDVVEEYELIQQKKSNLTKSQRDRIVRMFEYHFEPIQQP